ncbi:ATP-binding protein [Litoribrevibacter euphylliae]|uniref:histidine kinase n=1 Tax=Litoribrevibacter euphylliae TaxID=1834034 RepID=A0ABV7HCR3_9GAMM
MSKWFSRLTFQRKVLYVIIAVSILAVVISVTPQQINTISQQKDNLITQSRLQAKLIGQISAAGISFEQRESVNELLASLKVSPNIIAATILKRDEFSQDLSVFATFGEAISVEFFNSIIDQRDINLGQEQTYIFEPISLDGSVIGYTILTVDLKNLQNQVFNSIFLTLIAVVSALAIAFYISNIAQKALTKPVEMLTETTSKVANKQDYSLRADIFSDDELGTLSRSFNRMLDELERYDLQRKEQEDEIIRLNQSLEKKVEMRTDELKKANLKLTESLYQLQNTQKQMVEQEKMASLGSLVAGVAHEINTPIGIGITAISHLEHIITELEVPFQQGKLSKTNFENALRNLKECHTLVFSNLERAAQLVKSFKMVAVDQSSEEKRLFNLRSYLNDVITSLRPELRKTNLKLKLVIDENLFLNSFPGAFSQIFTNLIMNSIIHGFNDSDEGTIDINAQLKEETLIINYRDNGKGIGKEIAAKIFEPFFTTNRDTGGSGLGTHIIYNLVTQALHGSIELDQTSDTGAHFVILIPWNKVKADKA